MRNLLFTGLIVLFLCACTIGPDYVKPTVETPSAWMVSYDAAAELVNTAWWQQFNDPALDELITRALNENLDIKAATARVDQFLGQYRTTRSEFFPQIGASASAFRQKDTETGLLPGNNDDYRPTRERSTQLGKLTF